MSEPIQEVDDQSASDLDIEIVNITKQEHDRLLSAEATLKDVKEQLILLQKDLAAGPVKKPRPETLEGRTFKLRTNGGNLFLTINSLHAAPFEVFVRVGKAGDDVMCLCEAIGRQVSLALRYGLPLKEIIEELRGIGGDLPVEPSIPDAIGRALSSADCGLRSADLKQPDPSIPDDIQMNRYEKQILEGP